MARTMDSGGPTLSSPRWAGDYLDRNALLPGGAKLDPSQFLSTDAVVVTLTASALAAAVALTVAALSGPIPSGTVLNFGTNKFARLTAAAATGATSLTVAAIPTAMGGTETATYAGTGPKLVPSGTVVGRTIAERDASTGYGPHASGDDEVFIVALDVTDFTLIADVELYRHKRIVKENFLPAWTSLATATKTAVRSAYTCVRGGD